MNLSNCVSRLFIFLFLMFWSVVSGLLVAYLILLVQLLGVT